MYIYYRDMGNEMIYNGNKNHLGKGDQIPKYVYVSIRPYNPKLNPRFTTALCVQKYSVLLDSS